MPSETRYANIWFPWYAASLRFNLPLSMVTHHLITAYQPFMLLALKRWFPDFESHVVATGGTIKPYDVHQCLSGLIYGDPGYIQPEARCLPKHPNIPADGKIPHSFYLSRVLFEPLLRRLVKKRHPHIKFETGTVTGIVLDAGKKRVTGVEYTVDKGKRMKLECAFFVDCTGAARVGVKWLQKAGLPPPNVITYEPRLRYGGGKYFRAYLTNLGLLANVARSLLTHSAISQGQTPNSWWCQRLFAHFLCKCPAGSVRLEGYLGNQSRE